MKSASHTPHFPTTAWTCVLEAQNQDDPQFASAMNRLITAYWRPVFCCLRARGFVTQDAEDRTQEFFHTLLVRGWLKPADKERGRFRDFLFTLLQRFAYDKTVRAPRKEKFERSFVSVHSLMQESDRAYEPPARQTPEEVFRVQWKAETLASVRAALRAYYEGLNKPEERQRFEIFAALHFVDRVEDQPTQEELAARYGLSRDQVRYALELVQKRYERFLRQELRDQVDSEEDVEEALRELLAQG